MTEDSDVKAVDDDAEYVYLPAEDPVVTHAASAVMRVVTQTRIKGGWLAPPSPEHHPCDVPLMTYADAGRPWECADCGATWTLYRDSNLMPQLTTNAIALPRERTTVGLVNDWMQPTVHGQVGPDIQAQDAETASMVFKDPGFYEPLAEPGDGTLSKLSDHSTTCAFRLGTGMCSCPMRNQL